ncbi:MAG: methyltransferase domain-containing protein [Candidatus Binatus sp.]|jgi:trans-aconitate 2-methyltransferase|uniref:methyltransferase domain-containing protein n=1 Tax=Candidatus Binatus sp. TaxID=2811406 RepID=UPI003D0DAE79
MADWDPELYNRFRRYRAEPVEHILSRLQLADNELIIDLGCGSGENTLELARRSPRGSALGVDGSPAMIEAARKLLDADAAGLKARVSFELLNVPEFRADRAYTLIFSNATFHWIPDKLALFAACFDALRPGGSIVVQMPANETETAKMEIGRLARQAPWNTMLGGREHAFHEEPPEFYAAMLARLGYDRIDCYHLTFHHPMDRPADVVQWYRSTGLRPFLDALPADRHDEFLGQVTARLNSAYGTSGPMTFDFKRLFIWGRRPGT